MSILKSVLVSGGKSKAERGRLEHAFNKGEEQGRYQERARIKRLLSELGLALKDDLEDGKE